MAKTDISDIVKRLRDVEWMKFGPAAWNEIQLDRNEAADALERLEAKITVRDIHLKDAKAALAAKDAVIAKAHLDIMDLKADVEFWRNGKHAP